MGIKVQEERYIVDPSLDELLLVDEYKKLYDRVLEAGKKGNSWFTIPTRGEKVGYYLQVITGCVSKGANSYWELHSIGEYHVNLDSHFLIFKKVEGLGVFR